MLFGISIKSTIVFKMIIVVFNAGHILVTK